MIQVPSLAESFRQPLLPTSALSFCVGPNVLCPNAIVMISLSAASKQGWVQRVLGLGLEYKNHSQVSQFTVALTT